MQCCSYGATAMPAVRKSKPHPAPVLAGRCELPSMRAHVRSFALVPAGSVQWIAEKKARDQRLTGCPAHLWLIRGELYDLRRWAPSHPGGAEWLAWTQGTDCTVHFETHHMNIARARAVLRRFRVPTAQHQASEKGKEGPHAPDSQAQLTDPTGASAYVWRDGDLYDTLRAEAHAAVSAGGGSNATPLMVALSALSVAMWLHAYCVLCDAQSLFAAAVAGYWCFVLFGVGHNYFHQANCLWRFCADFTPFSSYDWRVSHAQSHHLYPNLGMDLEASGLEPLVSFMRNQPTNSPLVYLYWHVVSFLIGPIQVLELWWRIVTRRSALLPENLIVPAQLAVLVVCAGFGRGLLLWLTMHGVGIYLIQLVSTPLHRSEFSWTEGCEHMRARQDSFAEHTLASTEHYWSSFSARWPTLGLLLGVFVSGSFHSHVAHHLFPTLDHSRHHLVHDVLRKNCAAYGFCCDEQEISLWELVVSTVRCWCRPKGDLMYRPERAAGVQASAVGLGRKVR